MFSASQTGITSSRSLYEVEGGILVLTLSKYPLRYDMSLMSLMPLMPLTSLMSLPAASTK